MKRRCNICLQNKQHTASTRYNNEVTICISCQAIVKRINNDKALDYTSVK